MIPTVAEVRDGFVALHREARPMVRWWWFGPDVDAEEVERELTLMGEAGFGGAEIAYVYPRRLYYRRNLCRHYQIAQSVTVNILMKMGIYTFARCVRMNGRKRKQKC